MRYPAPSGNLPLSEMAQNLKIELINDYPVWNETITDASLRIILHNASDRHIGAQCKAILYVYDYTEKVPKFWSPIDLAFGKTADNGTFSVISLPVGANKELSVPLLDTIWADVTVKTAPYQQFYPMVTEGRYLMRLELTVYDEKDTESSTVLSNFIEFNSRR